jgi:hypothetical protein
LGLAKFIKKHAEHLEVPDDAVNGLILTLLKNVQPDAQQTAVSMGCQSEAAFSKVSD